MIVLTGLSVLCVTSCGSSKRISRDTVSAYETKATTNFTNYTNERDSVVVMERDTVMVTKTVTVDRNERGDTVRIATVTDRERGRSRDAIAVERKKVETVRDTVYIEKKDSSLVKSEEVRVKSDQGGGSALHTTLKWVFWIIVAVTILTITITITKMMRR